MEQRRKRLYFDVYCDVWEIGEKLLILPMDLDAPLLRGGSGSRERNPLWRFPPVGVDP